MLYIKKITNGLKKAEYVSAIIGQRYYAYYTNKKTSSKIVLLMNVWSFIKEKKKSVHTPTENLWWNKEINKYLKKKTCLIVCQK